MEALATTTAELRAPTGLDQRTRGALLRKLTSERLDGYPALLAALIDRGAWANWDECLEGVEEVWGNTPAEEIREAIDAVPDRHTTRLDWERVRLDHEREDRARAALLVLPEPDFLSAIEAGAERALDPFELARVPQEINRICELRGVPYRLRGVGSTLRFEWVGDEEIAARVIGPALSALDDPRLSGGARQEFNDARQQLREATPSSRKRAVHEACSAVESALKVLLSERGVPYSPKATLQPLFNAARDAGLLSGDLEEIITGAGRFGNRRSRHGAGVIAHDVPVEEAEAAVAAAAVAIALVAKRLP